MRSLGRVWTYLKREICNKNKTFGLVEAFTNQENEHVYKYIISFDRGFQQVEMSH